MKKAIVVLAAMALSVTLSYSQTNTRVYGPKAKNNKVWVNKSQKSTVHTASKEKVTGGAAKNNHSWAKAPNDSEKTTVGLHNEKLALKGPAAKNYKYHKKGTTSNTPAPADSNYVENRKE